MFLTIVTIMAFVVQNVIAGACIYFVGLVVYEIWAVLSLKNKKKNEISISTNFHS